MVVHLRGRGDSRLEESDVPDDGKMTLSKLSILMKTPEASVPGWLEGTGVFDAATEAEPKVSLENFLENLLGTKSDEIRKKRGRMFIS